MTVQAGTLINDRYQIDRQIGTGGMATVWLADDRLLGRKVAVKILSDRYASNPDFVERFRREASAAAKLSHPNIVAVFDRGEYEGNYYIVMEYLPGPDLKQIVRQQGPLAPRHAVDAALQILAALGAAHKRDVIHRDVKPQNVMVSEDGHLKVTDFGIARAGDEADMTEVGSVIGTAQYLSPEQARGDDVTTASDCYAVGIVLYELLTGRVPFDGDTPVSVAMRQVNELPVAPRLLAPAIPDELNDVVMRALEKRPGARYRTAQEFMDALLAIRDRLPEPDQRTALLAPMDPPTRVIPTVRPPEPATAATRRVAPAEQRQLNTSPPPSATPPRKKGRGRLVALIAILLLAIVGGAAAFILGGGDDGKTIPDVTDTPAAEARAELTNAGFEVVEEQNPDPVIVADHVINTSPPAGEKVKKGSKVTMNVSTGKQMADVPDVTGMDWETARTTLDDANFVPVKAEAYDATTKKGLVASQSLEAGSSQPEQSKVTVTVSLGPELVAVPNLALMSQDEAEAQLQGLEFISVPVDRPTSRRGPGLVVGQDPPASRKVEKGSRVTIYISVARTSTTSTTPDTPSPGSIQVPDVLGSNFQDARTKIQAEGLPAPISGGSVSGSEPDGTVVRQDPAPGTSVSADTVVTIIVSNGQGSSPATQGN